MQKGRDVELVVFDPETMKDRATEEAPTEPTVGVQYLLVARAAGSAGAARSCPVPPQGRQWSSRAPENLTAAVHICMRLLRLRVPKVNKQPFVVDVVSHIAIAFNRVVMGGTRLAVNRLHSRTIQDRH